MLPTDEQSKLLKTILLNSGFKGCHKGYYWFDRSKTSSEQRFLTRIGWPEFLKDYEELETLFTAFHKNKIDVKILDPIIEEITSENTSQKPMVGIAADPDAEKDYMAFRDGLRPILNTSKSNGQEVIMLLDENNHNYPVMDFNEEIYLAQMGITAQEFMAQEGIIKTTPVFNPDILSGLFMPKGVRKKGIYHLNLYIPAPWRFMENITPKYDGFIKCLIEHLFPIKEEQIAVLDWMHHAITYRAQTVLCLVGSRGIGKGLLMNEIMSALVGREYRQIVGDSILTDKFNGAFKFTRYVFFDEVNISGEKELASFKKFTNDEIAIEQKGKDAETIKNYASTALASNEKRHIRISPQERRFSIPELTEKAFTEVKSEEEIREFLERISAPESIEIAEFGHYLIQRKPKYKAFHTIKSAYYFDICRLSRPEWQNFLEDYLIHSAEHGKPISLKTMGREFRDENPELTWPKKASFLDHLSQYLYMGKYKIGTIVEIKNNNKGRMEPAILVNSDFLKYAKEITPAPIVFDVTPDRMTGRVKDTYNPNEVAPPVVAKFMAKTQISAEDVW